MNDKVSTLRTHLDRVLRQWRMTIVLQGLAVTAAVGIILIGLSMGLDYVVGLDTLARGGLLLICLIGIGVMIVQYLIRPLRRIPDDLQVARYVEEQHPELNDGFVSAVEFEGKSLDGAAQVFLDRLIKQVTAQSNQINFTRIIDRRRLRRSEGMALLAIVLLSLFATQDVDLFRRMATRLATPWTHPGPLLATGLQVSPGDARLQRGSNQLVTVKVSGHLTPEVRLLSRAEDQEEWYPVDMFENEEVGTFTYELAGITGQTEYYVEASPATSQTYTIAVFDPPGVERIDVTYRYPSYTGLARKTEEDIGDITAPVGTTVTLTITANKPIESGKLAFSNGKSHDLEVDDLTLTETFKIREDLSYTINLLDTDGLTNSNPVEYYIRALPDRAPTVTITKPGRDTQVSPIEEMNIRVEAEDDFGLSSLSIVYSVNGGPEQTIDLAAETKKQSQTLWDGEHIVYLEELTVQPGDFISYYARASDRRGEAGTTATDMYFAAVKPFEEIYRQGNGGGGGGGGVAGVQPGRLSQDQKEIIAATWRVDRDRKRVSEQQTKDDLNTIADAQDGLRTRVDEAISMVMFQGSMEPELQEMADLLQEATGPMEQASEQLRVGLSQETLPTEREALQYLLKVDALIREYMITMANSQSHSGAQLDMSDTSELELKRDENRYETLDQSNQTQQQQQTVDESLQRVRDLARRQQQLNNQMRQLANQDRRSAAERQRELDRLTREQRQLRQQAEEISRQMSQMSSEQQSSAQEMRRSLQEASQSLRESSEEMGQSTQQLQRNNPQQATGQGSQALQHLEDANQELGRAQGRSMERMVRDAVQRADQLATRQDQLARAVEALKKEQDRDNAGIKARIDALDNGVGGLTEADKARRVDQFVRKRLDDITEAKDETKRDLGRLKDDLEFLSGRTAGDQPQTAERLREALRNIDQGDLDRKIDRSKQLLQPKSLDRSQKAEQDLTQAFEQLADQVRTAQESLTIPDQDQLARSQDQARDALSGLQNLQRQLSRMQRNPLPGMDQALSQQYQQRLQDMQNLSNHMPQNSQPGQQLRDQLARASALGNEPWKIDRREWDELSQDIARALLDVHKELNDRLQDTAQREKLFMARDEDVPPQYRDLVNRYYEKLSKETNE